MQPIDNMMELMDAVFVNLGIESTHEECLLVLDTLISILNVEV